MDYAWGANGLDAIITQVKSVSQRHPLTSCAWLPQLRWPRRSRDGGQDPQWVCSAGSVVFKRPSSVKEPILSAAKLRSSL